MDDDLIRTEQPHFEDLESDTVRSGPDAVPKALRDEDHSPSARETRESGQPDALVSYIRSISKTPILSREQQYEIAGALEAHREAFLDAIFAVPATATEIVRRWRERKAAGYVTATLSAHHLDGSGRDLSAEIDRAPRRSWSPGAMRWCAAGSRARRDARARIARARGGPLSSGRRRSELTRCGFVARSPRGSAADANSSGARNVRSRTTK
jgi:hypothetical protein